MFTKKVLLAALLMTAVLAVGSRGEVVYQYTKVADGSLANFGNLGLYPGLNNNNQVSYVLRSGSATGSIMRWENGVSTSLGTGSFVSQVPINDNGAVAFDNGTRGYIASGSGQVELFSSTRGVGVYGVNTSGEVIAAVETSDNVYEIRSRQIGGSSQFVFSNSSSGAYSSFAGSAPPLPDINAAGDVVARGWLRSTGLDGIHIHTRPGMVTVADTSGPLQSFGNIVDINDAGHVAYYGTPDGLSGVKNLFIYDGIASNLIASHTDFSSLSDAGLLINNTGGLIFGGTADGVAGLFTGANPQTDRVLSVGDALDSARVTDLLIRRGMLNDSGNFVFTAYLDDNLDGSADRNAVFFANAVAVPEPSSIGLLAFATLVYLKRCRGKQSLKAAG